MMMRVQIPTFFRVCFVLGCMSGSLLVFDRAILHHHFLERTPADLEDVVNVFNALIVGFDYDARYHVSVGQCEGDGLRVRVQTVRECASGDAHAWVSTEFGDSGEEGPPRWNGIARVWRSAIGSIRKDNTAEPHDGVTVQAVNSAPTVGESEEVDLTTGLCRPLDRAGECIG
jgi:hypothetical protein